MPNIINDKLISWASIIDDGTIRQAERLARLPEVTGHVALMPDAHYGIDSTVGSVIPTTSAILPSAVGGDIGCFLGSTKVPLLDGTQKTIEELTKEKSPFWIYAIDDNGSIAPARATASKTRGNAVLLEVTVSGGDTIVCTPDHRFMLKNGTYCEAKDLRFNTSLMPLYRSWSTRDGYESMSAGTGTAQRTHIVVWTHLHGPVPPGHVVHHDNHNHFDNRPENLVLMTAGAHTRFHNTKQTHFDNSDPEFTKKRMAGIARSKENPETQAKRRRVGTENITRYMEEHPEEFAEAVAGNGHRGAPFLTKFNTTPRTCSECSEEQPNPTALRWHTKREHEPANHKVIAVRSLDYTADVYCLTVPQYGNFALAAGIFVHNCGMISVELDVRADQLPDDLTPLLSSIEATIPGGPSRGYNDTISKAARTWMATHHPRTELTTAQESKALAQLGTLGGGNHFVEVCLDETDHVWVTLHSGSRGIGGILANLAIANAKTLANDLHLRLEDPSLAYLLEGSPEFDTYIADMLWAQDYALANREHMMDRVLHETVAFIGTGRELNRINCHHNFTARETFNGIPMWITRKGAVRARVGDLGMIPGSMGAQSYIIEGLGNELSWNSCAHGAGRLYSRSGAKAAFTVADLEEQMKGKVWLSSKARGQLDELPSAYKPIDQVMADQADLVRVLHTLHQVINYKGA
jgi:tRNA-splicing ligase RtcB